MKVRRALQALGSECLELMAELAGGAGPQGALRLAVLPFPRETPVFGAWLSFIFLVLVSSRNLTLIVVNSLPSKDVSVFLFPCSGNGILCLP